RANPAGPARVDGGAEVGVGLLAVGVGQGPERDFDAATLPQGQPPDPGRGPHDRNRRDVPAGSDRRCRAPGGAAGPAWQSAAADGGEMNERQVQRSNWFVGRYRTSTRMSGKRLSRVSLVRNRVQPCSTAAARCNASSALKL